MMPRGGGRNLPAFAQARLGEQPERTSGVQVRHLKDSAVQSKMHNVDRTDGD